MSPESVTTLCLTALTLGVMHTAMGPDHYVPFIALSKDGGWSLRGTVWVTAACGIAHVLSSVLLGFLGVFLGSTVQSLTRIESLRGDAAGWLLFGFGLAYAAWGLRVALRSPRHTHWHAHADGTFHSHLESQGRSHTHANGAVPRTGSFNTWVLFLIFAFGPCEPLIPLLVYPAATHSYGTAMLVSAVFGLATLATMLAFVLAGCYGLSRWSTAGLQRYSHALCGTAIAACGGLMCLGF